MLQGGLPHSHWVQQRVHHPLVALSLLVKQLCYFCIWALWLQEISKVVL